MYGAGALGTSAIAILRALYPTVEVMAVARFATQTALAESLGAVTVVPEPPEQLVEVALKMGPAPFWKGLSSELKDSLGDQQLWLPSARSRHETGAMLDLLTELLGKYGLEPRQMRVKYPRDSFFSKGSRAALIEVAGLTHETAADDLYPRREKLMLRFDLPRGCYATILIKRLTEV